MNANATTLPGRTAFKAPVRLAIVNDYEIVVSGLASMLEEHRDRVHVVEINAQTPVLSDVDVVLVDTFGQLPRAGATLDDLVRDSDAPVVLYSWEMSPDGIANALTAGAGGYLSKSLRAREIVRALEAIRDGEVVVLAGDSETSVGGAGDWPGRSAGLSPREAEILALITQGLSNQEIAEQCYLSINSVKTYIRTAYRKIGVTRRSHAVLWGVDHGFKPETLGTVDPALLARPSPLASPGPRP